MTACGSYSKACNITSNACGTSANHCNLCNTKTKFTSTRRRANAHPCFVNSVERARREIFSLQSFYCKQQKTENKYILQIHNNNLGPTCLFIQRTKAMSKVCILHVKKTLQIHIRIASSTVICFELAIAVLEHVFVELRTICFHKQHVFFNST